MNNQRVIYFDVLNILAAISVVFIHCNSSVHAFSNTAAWRQALSVEVLLYWAVPIFFMLSGATLLNYRTRYTTAEFFKKRFTKILIPFVIWSAIYAVYYKINPLEIGVAETINRIFNTQILTTFWFFIPLMSVYLAIPVLSVLTQHKRLLWYMVSLSFLLSTLLPCIFSYMKLNWNYSLDDLVTGGFLIYTILGYLLSKTSFSRNERFVIYALGIFSLVLRYFLTIYLSVRDNTLNRTFFDYLQYHVVLLASAVFVFFKNSKTIHKISNYPKFSNWLKNISGLSFGVYLIHILVMEILQKFIDNSTYIWRLALPILIYFISCCIIFVLKKIPVIKHTIP